MFLAATTTGGLDEMIDHHCGLEPIAQARFSRRRLLSAAWVATLPLVGPTISLASEAGRPPPLSRAPDGRSLRLTFGHTFDDASRLPGRDPTWRTTYGVGQSSGFDQRSIPSSGEQQVYVDPAFTTRLGAGRLDPFSIRDGVLEITADRTPAALVQALGGHPYISGVMTTQPSFSQLYGYFEVRAQLPNGKGLWPALWMLPADNTWPPEIDIMESIGDASRVYLTAHSAGVTAHSIEARLADRGFHTFATSWDRQQLVWYVDGREAARQPTPPDMHKPMFLIANLAVGGTWPGAPDASTPFPAKLSIMSVRAYQFA